MAGAAAGSFIDERHHLGFTNWRSACRAAGFSLRPMIEFSFELLPTAITGFLVGGLSLLVLGLAMRRHGGEARLCFAAHAGCVITMPVGMALCTLALPPHAMLLADGMLALTGAGTVFWLMSRHGAAAAGANT